MKVVRIYGFILLVKEYLLNAKYVPFTGLSPEGLKIYLVGAFDRKEEIHIIKIIAIDQGWGYGSAHRLCEHLGEGVSERS